MFAVCHNQAKYHKKEKKTRTLLATDNMPILAIWSEHKACARAVYSKSKEAKVVVLSHHTSPQILYTVLKRFIEIF